MEEINFNEIEDDVSDITPDEYKDTELRAITDLAQNIGLFEWKYDVPLEGTDNKLHIGPIAQDLLRVPELRAAVHKDPKSGYLKIDTKLLSLAAISYVATLARIVGDIQYKGPNVEK